MSGINKSGPLFDGVAQQELDNFFRQAKVDIAQEGVNLVHQELSHVLRHPTGYYESQVRTDITAHDPAVTDGGVIYGPWLEGTGSRNRTTRFKGYFTFRRVSQALQQKSGAIAERTLKLFIGRMQ